MLCSTKNCQNSCKEYCQYHKRQICTCCRIDYHSQCRVLQIPNEKELRYQVASLRILINSTKKSFHKFGLDSICPDFTVCILTVQKEFAKLSSQVCTAIAKRDYKEYGNYSARLTEFRACFCSDSRISYVMAESFQRSALENMPEMVGSLRDCAGGEGKEDRGDLGWSEGNEEREEDKEGYVSRGYGGDGESQDKVCSVEETPEFDHFVQKYFPDVGWLDRLVDFTFWMTDKTHFHFIQECIDNKVILARFPKVRFVIDFDCCPLLKEYIEVCVPEEFCNELVFESNSTDIQLQYSSFSDSVEKILENPPKIIIFKEISFTHNELRSFQEKSDSSGLKLRLENCRIVMSGEYLGHRITDEEKRNTD
ncbi:unnamed protein product [Moneuplotes crassus]|uniref:Uncharacterized protein n=1 Tax=Euplotes crassus TaxID=5936 RepID=A0AAD1XHM1_EUPCR|nr:unnamed protein product [Moneuplotes crassus]